MNELSKSASGLVDVLTPTLQKLSETFCVSIDFVKENAMQYIIGYHQKYIL